MFKILIFVLILMWLEATGKPLQIEVSGQSAILMNAKNGNIIFEKNAYRQYYPASITKIATALYALEKQGHNLDVMVRANQNAIGAVSSDTKKCSNYSLPPHLIEFSSSHIGIKKDEELSLRTLLHGMMIASANDAANVIATYIGNSIPKFMKELNIYLKKIGCKNTIFHNPHGLHHPDHKTTAYDMAILTRKALENDIFRDIIRKKHYKRPKTNKQEPAIMTHTNKLLKPGKYYYPNATGVKTGHTKDAHGTIVAAASDSERTLIAVVLCSNSAQGKYEDVIKMFKMAFGEKKTYKQVISPGKQSVKLKLKNANTLLETYVKEKVKIEYFKSEKPAYSISVAWNELKLPISKNQKVGDLILQIAENKPYRVALYANNNVKVNLFTSLPTNKVILSICILMFIAGLIFVLNKLINKYHSNL